MLTVLHNDMHIYEQFLKLSVGFGFKFSFVHLFRFSILCVFLVSLDYFVLVLFAFVVLDVVFSSVICQEVGREEGLQNDLFCVEWDVRP